MVDEIPTSLKDIEETKRYGRTDGRYQIAPSKAVVGVDRPIKALSSHIQKPLRITKGNNSHRIGP